MSDYTKFNHRLDRVSAAQVSAIAQIDELKGSWVGGLRLSPQTLGRLKRSVLVTSTGASTRIEGANLSDEDIEKLMRGIRIETFSNRDDQEVAGYYELLANVFDSWEAVSFGEPSIKHFHQELLKYVVKDVTHRGEYKKQENKVHMVDEAGQSLAILFDTTDPHLVPKEMQELLEWTKHALEECLFHPLLVIGNFVVEFLAIHPFQDGNGRLSRVLTNLLLLQSGYLYVPYVSHEKLIEDNKPEYYIALRTAQKTITSGEDDISSWLDFFFTILKKQAQLAQQLITNENIEQLLSQKQLLVWQYLQAVDSASPKEIAEETKVAQPTVRQSLEKLMAMNRIQRLGQGRSTRYKMT